jgi:hypothetical protein
LDALLNGGIRPRFAVGARRGAKRSGAGSNGVPGGPERRTGALGAFPAMPAEAPESGRRAPGGQRKGGEVARYPAS